MAVFLGYNSRHPVLVGFAAAFISEAKTPRRITLAAAAVASTVMKNILAAQLCFT
jgi:hypothetical protein